MQYYYHEQLTDVDESGFGATYVTHPSSYVQPHWHRAVELHYFLTGSAAVKFGTETIHVKAGELYLFNSYDIHESWFSPDATYLCVHILPAQMCRYVQNFDQLRFSLHLDPENLDQVAAFSRLQAHMAEILLLYQEKPEGYRLQCQALLYSSVNLLVRYFSQPLVPETELHRGDMARLEPVLDYIELHHGEELTLDGAANAVGLSKEYFCRLFKKNLGVSFLQYVNQLRVAAVGRELETSGEPISVLAERHGFRNVKLFNQLFKEFYGCTPTEKRKQLQKGESKQRKQEEQT